MLDGPAGPIINFLHRKYMTGFGKNKKYRGRFVENFNGMIIGRGLLRNEKKRDAGPKYLALTFFQKGIVSLYEKTFNFNPVLFWESWSSYLGYSFRRFPRPSARQAEPSQNRARHSSN